nr:MAG TPA: hypothetical protein [Caudoviricetes sp.]
MSVSPGSCYNSALPVCAVDCYYVAVLAISYLATQFRSLVD